MLHKASAPEALHNQLLAASFLRVLIEYTQQEKSPPTSEQGELKLWGQCQETHTNVTATHWSWWTQDACSHPVLLTHPNKKAAIL